MEFNEKFPNCLVENPSEIGDGRSLEACTTPKVWMGRR